MAYPYFPNYSPWMQYNSYTPTPMNTHAQIPAGPQSPSSGFTWVQGIEGAKAHAVPAGVSALLMDSEKERFYIKGSDASGMPLPLRVFEYKEIKESEPVSSNHPMTEHVTKEEFERFKAELRGADEDE